MPPPVTGPFRQLIQNFSPPWVLREYGERLSQGMIALVGDLFAESAVSAVISPMLADPESPPDAVGLMARSRMIDRYPADTTETHRARALDAWDAWTGAGTRESILGQLTAFGYPSAYISQQTDADFSGDFNPALPRRFWILVTLEGLDDPPDAAALVGQIFRLASKFRAGEERIEDVTVLTAGRVWDYHLVTGLPHTWDDPGPGITTWDSSTGVTYRETI